jgi:hypothetical protein
VWHASVSYQSTTAGPVALGELPRPARALVERAAKALLAGAGTGRRRWQHGEAPHVLHVRRRLSDAEIAVLPDGPDPIDAAGGGPLYFPRTTTP